MVIQQEETQPTVDLVNKATQLLQNKYSDDNHVAVPSTSKPSEVLTNVLEEEMPNVSVTKSKKRRRDSVTDTTNYTLLTGTSKKSEINISKTDLNELRTVYKKCKAIVKKIESKYGHLLQSDSETSSDVLPLNENKDEKCKCKLGKKTVFDESGNEIPVELNLAEHKCPQKPADHFGISTQQQNVQIEYSKPNEVLPDDLKTLVKILQNCDLDNSYRYMVISKIQFLRQQYADELRYNKKSLIEQLRVNPYDILHFQGTNLSTITGYK